MSPYAKENIELDNGKNNVTSLRTEGLIVNRCSMIKPSSVQSSYKRVYSIYQPAKVRTEKSGMPWGAECEEVFTNNTISWHSVQNGGVFCELIWFSKTVWANHMECLTQLWVRSLLGYMVVKLYSPVWSWQTVKVMAITKVKCHGEMGMLYLGVLMGIHNNDTQMDVTSNCTYDYNTLSHAWNL